MVVKANLPRGTQKGASAFVAALTVALSASSIIAPAAQAAEPNGEGRSSTAGAEAMDWRPTLTPFYSDRETVRRNLSGTQRGAALRNCPSGYLCVAAGEGDGQHTVYTLYYCTSRSLSNFINAGAVNNNQTGGAVTRLLGRDGRALRSIRAGSGVVGVDWYPVWYIDPC